MKNLIYILLFSLLPLFASSSNDEKHAPVRRTLAGKITDSYGEAIPGVRIKVKESGQEYFADFEGHFQISLASNSNETLIIESLGFEAMEIPSSELGFQPELILKSL